MTQEIEAYFVCFHRSRGIVDQIGEYGTLRSAVLAASSEAMIAERRINIYPIFAGGKRGKLRARVSPHLFGKSWEAGIARYPSKEPRSGSMGLFDDANETVKIGIWSKPMAECRNYVSPTGSSILGTLERLTGRAEIDGIDPETGEPQYSGGTEIFYDDQETVLREGDGDVYRRMVYLDEDGDEWTFDQLIDEETWDAEHPDHIDQDYWRIP